MVEWNGGITSFKLAKMRPKGHIFLCMRITIVICLPYSFTEVKLGTARYMYSSITVTLSFTLTIFT